MKPESPVVPGYDLPEVVYAKDQPEYQPLPVVKIEGPEGQVLSRWHLSTEDRERIADGQDVYLWVCTFGRPLQPVLLEVRAPHEVVTTPTATNGEEWPDVISAG